MQGLFSQHLASHSSKTCPAPHNPWNWVPPSHVRLLTEYLGAVSEETTIPAATESPRVAYLLTTQFILTINAFSCLLAHEVDVDEIHVISRRHEAWLHDHTLIRHFLLPLIEARGYRTAHAYEDDPLIHAIRPKAMTVMRIDHQTVIPLIQSLRPEIVIETGESIGVEPKLYALKSRLRRKKVILTTLCYPFKPRLHFTYTCNSSGCNPTLINAALATFSQLREHMPAHPVATQLMQADTHTTTFLVLLPYLKLHQPHHKLKLLTWKVRKVLKNLQGRTNQRLILGQTANFINSRLNSTAGRQSFRVMVKPHPKNFRDLPEILSALAVLLGNHANYAIEGIEAESSLEEIFLAIGPESLAKISISIVGFGTNVLSAMLLQYPYLGRVSLVPIAQTRVGRALRMSFNAIFNRSEFLRRRHVSAMMRSLQSQLSELTIAKSSLPDRSLAAPYSES